MVFHDINTCFLLWKWHSDDMYIDNYTCKISVFIAMVIERRPRVLELLTQQYPTATFILLQII